MWRLVPGDPGARPWRTDLGPIERVLLFRQPGDRRHEHSLGTGSRAIVDPCARTGRRHLKERIPRVRCGHPVRGSGAANPGPRCHHCESLGCLPIGGGIAGQHDLDRRRGPVRGDDSGAGAHSRCRAPPPDGGTEPENRGVCWRLDSQLGADDRLAAPVVDGDPVEPDPAQPRASQMIYFDDHISGAGDNFCRPGGSCGRLGQQVKRRWCTGRQN